MIKENLKLLLNECDGQAVTILSEARAKYRHEPDFIFQIINLISDPVNSVSDGASWILKAELEDGLFLQTDLTEKLVEQLGQVSSCQTIMHFLQIIDMISLTEKQAITLFD